MTITRDEMKHLVSAAAWFIGERAVADRNPTTQAAVTLDRANTAFQKLYEGTLSRHPEIDRMSLYDVVMQRAKRLHLGAGGTEYDCDPDDSQEWFGRPYERLEDEDEV